MLFWYNFGPKLKHIGLLKVFHILIEAQQFLNFLAPENFSLLNFLKIFLVFGHFEPHLSYKSFLIKTRMEFHSCEAIEVCEVAI